MPKKRKQQKKSETLEITESWKDKKNHQISFPFLKQQQTSYLAKKINSIFSFY